MQAVPPKNVPEGCEVKQMLRQIAENIARLSLQGIAPAQADEIRENPSGECSLAQNVDVDEKQPRAKLLAAVSQLCDIAYGMQGRTSPCQPEEVFHCLTSVLSLMTSSEYLGAVVTSGLMDTTVCSTCAKRRARDLQAGLNSILGALLSVQQVEVHKPGEQHTPNSVFCMLLLRSNSFISPIAQADG